MTMTISMFPDMALKDQDITIKRVHWDDKVTNLNEMAKGLNIGLDSMVFVDDSDFEVTFVRAQCPAVTVVQVPNDLNFYPTVLRQMTDHFFRLIKPKKIRKEERRIRRRRFE